MLPEHLGRVNRQRRIEKDRRRRYFAALHQVDQIDDQFLGAFDGEGGDQQGALGRRGVADLGGEALTALFRRRCGANPVAVSRFRNHVIEARRRLRIGLQQLRIGTDIAGSEQAQRMSVGTRAVELEFDRGRAEQMPGIPVARANARYHVDPCLVFDRLERLQRGDRIGLGIDRD